jgi:hypothetical protein
MACFLTILVNTSKSMKKIIFSFTCIAALASCFVSCKKENTSNEGVSLPPGPQDTITSFMVNFYNTSDSTVEVGSYDDPDGAGPIAPNIGGASLKKNASYIITFLMEDATDAAHSVFIQNKIKTNGKDYKICIGSPLGISVNATDSDGSRPIGLTNNMSTSSTTGSGKMNFSIKYQKGVKDGQCAPGLLLFNCDIPVTVY